MTNTFNLVQTSTVLQKRWKFILGFVLLCAVAATVTVFVVPPYYKSSASVVSANPALADKARFFEKNVQSLYSYFGSGDDLDRVYGMAEMGSVYAKLVNEFSLVDYYDLKGDSLPILVSKAAKSLQKDISITRTEENQLKIVAWTKDRQLSAKLVNRMVAIIQETAKEIWQMNYTKTITVFDSTLLSMEAQYRQLSDSVRLLTGVPAEIARLKLSNLSESIRKFNTTADEFKIGSKALSEFLYVLEPAVPATYAERPDKPVIIFSACLLAFLFSSLLVLISDRRKMD